MSDSKGLYDVRERTGNPEHASVDDVVELVFERAQHPRTDHHDGHLDEQMATVVDRYGTAPVRTVIHRVLVDGAPGPPLRTSRYATSTVFVYGTTAGQFLDELNAQDDG